jgi:hypothetical protein
MPNPELRGWESRIRKSQKLEGDKLSGLGYGFGPLTLNLYPVLVSDLS